MIDPSIAFLVSPQHPIDTQLRMSFLQDMFSGFGKQQPKQASPPKISIVDLKGRLAEEMMQPKPDRASIEKIIDEMKDVSPIKATAASPLLQKKWFS